MEFKPEKYGKNFVELYLPEKLNSLGSGQPDRNFSDKMNILSIESLFGDTVVQDIYAAQACISALWLHHDFLDESHTISQGNPTPTGSFWHGIMHRREGDYWNSKYWFRRVEATQVFADLAREALEITVKNKSSELKKSLSGTSWDPFLFIDLSEEYYRSGTSEEQIIQQIQRVEWQVLFEFCFSLAIKHSKNKDL